MDQLFAIEQRQRNLRIVLFVIILATLPFYCAGILLLGTATQKAGASGTNTPTFTPIRRTQTPTVRPTNTPFAFGTVTALSPLVPTPGQFFPVATRFLSPTPFILPTNIFIPTSTLAPTLTPYPTDVPPPQPTVPPPPTDPPPPTLTPLPTQEPPTDPPPPTIEEPSPLPPPSDTPPGEAPPVDEPPPDDGGGE